VSGGGGQFAGHLQGDELQRVVVVGWSCPAQQFAARALAFALSVLASLSWAVNNW